MQTQEILNHQNGRVPKVHLLGCCVELKNIYFHGNNIIIDG